MKKLLVILLIAGAIVVFIFKEKRAIEEWYNDVNTIVMGVFMIPTKEDIKHAEKLKAQQNPATYFSDQKVIDLCLAARDGNTEKINSLTEEGIDINTIGKNGITPLAWMFINIVHTPEQKKGFVELLDQGANPFILYKTGEQNYKFVLEAAARGGYTDKLKLILDSGMVNREAMEFSLELIQKTGLSGMDIPTSQQDFIDELFTVVKVGSYKMFLEYALEMNFVTKDSFEARRMFSRSFLVYAEWKEIFDLLQLNIDYNMRSKPDQVKSDIIEAIESDNCKPGDCYHPSQMINSKGADYRHLVIEFLEAKGEKIIYPKLPKDEKYTKENDQWVLYVNEKFNKKGEEIRPDDYWVKFKESYKYQKPKTKEERLESEKLENAIYELQRILKD